MCVFVIPPFTIKFTPGGEKFNPMNFQSVNVSLIREQNLSLVLQYLLQKSPQTSRSDLMRLTNLSGTTVSSLVNILLDTGFVSETGVGESIGGRRPITIELNPTFRYSMGVDIGASHITCMIVDLKGRLVARLSEPFDVIHHARATMNRVCEMIGQTLEAAHLDLSKIAGLGVSIPAPLDGEKQDRLLAFYMPDWEGMVVLDELRPHLTIPMFLENDANAGSLAEKWWGVGQQHHSLAFIKLGVGVGAGLIINDEIYRGFAGSAGEIGHTTIESKGRLCRCGNRGCMESYVGIPGILKDVQSKRATSDTGPLTIESVIAAAKNGEPVSAEVIQTAGRYLGIAIANLLNLVNPEIVILNGTIMDAGDLLMREVVASMLERTLPLRAEFTPIVASCLGRDAIAMGAATLVIHNLIQPENVNQFLHFP